MCSAVCAVLCACEQPLQHTVVTVIHSLLLKCFSLATNGIFTHFSDVDHLVEIAEAVQSKLDAFKADKRDLGTVSTAILYTKMYIHVVASVSWYPQLVA